MMIVFKLLLSLALVYAVNAKAENACKVEKARRGGGFEELEDWKVPCRRGSCDKEVMLLNKYGKPVHRITFCDDEELDCGNKLPISCDQEDNDCPRFSRCTTGFRFDYGNGTESDEMSFCAFRDYTLGTPDFQGCLKTQQNAVNDV